MVAVIGRLVAFTAMKAGISPVPPAARPMAVLLLVHVNTVPATVPVKFTGAVNTPAHNAWLAGWFTCGVGFTVMVKLKGRLTQVIPPLV